MAGLVHTCLVRVGNVKLVRLADDDRFGPYALVSADELELLHCGWSRRQAGLWLLRYRTSDMDHVHYLLEDAELWAQDPLIHPCKSALRAQD